MGSVDYVGLDSVPDAVGEALKMAAANAAHLAQALKANGYPGVK